MNENTPEHLVVDELTVHRINVQEADGRVRMVLSNGERLPGATIRGKEYDPHRSHAGLIFFNDEETESGGLIFGGRDGRQSGSLTFDAYEQDQVVQVLGCDGPEGIVAGVVVSERPRRSIAEDLDAVDRPRAEEQSSEVIDDQMEGRERGRPRGFFGHRRGEAAVELADGKGRARLRPTVAANGNAAIQFLDEQGEVISSLTPEGFHGHQEQQ